MRHRRVTFLRRRKFGSMAAPTFFKLNDNLDPVGIVFTNWKAAYGKDPLTEEARIILLLTNTDGASSTKLATKEVSHAKLNDLFYRIRGGRKILGKHTDYVLYLSTSGETTATS